MQFTSDNTGPVHPAVMAALADANEGYAPSYGADDLTARVTAQIRDVFEAPEAAVYLVATGTAANALSLACLAQPWQTVFCARHAHIQEDECGAPEFYTHGAKLTLLDETDGRMDADALARAIAAEESRGVHGVQRGPVSITQATELGTVHDLPTLRALTDVARGHGLPVHMDGARFANALVRLGCTPAEMTWKAGVDVLSFGGTKNGLMAVEAVVMFDPARAWEFELRRKRAAQLFSKHRYLAAQMAAYLDGALWLDLAARANAQADRLAAGLTARGIALAAPPEANMVFAKLPRDTDTRLRAAGATYIEWDSPADVAAPVTARLVCDWSTPDSAIDAFLGTLDA
ncbi:threonine aldolase family protein [Meridianimarinicoccus sp. RP-17]|uniref:threonine aldolase family protein n=1 Tax=Meridianimarinicoccus zhengii TaxID=2056810 RepID=UPI000DABC00C|nr:beta-eliminating lyase-related protein [Phycocomes zhengii]